MPTPPPNTTPTLKTLKLFRVKLVDRASVSVPHNNRYIAARSLEDALILTGKSIVLGIEWIGNVDLES